MFSGFLLWGCDGNKQAGETKAGGSSQQSDFPRDKTLYLGDDQWGDPNTFNPLCDWPAWPIRGKDNVMLYEPLMIFNSLTGQMEPVLGHTLEKSADAIGINLDSRAKWSAGTPLTAKHVVFTYEVELKLKNVSISYLKDLISGMTVAKVTDPVTGGKIQADKISLVVNKKERKHPFLGRDHLQAIRILPKFVIGPMLQKVGKKLSVFQNEKVDKNLIFSENYNILSSLFGIGGGFIEFLYFR
jgi:peptide/nickel transport system substrate-binding protein